MLTVLAVAILALAFFGVVALTAMARGAEPRDACVAAVVVTALVCSTAAVVCSVGWALSYLFAGGGA